MEVIPPNKVNRLRIEVEPVNVELDQDGGILWTALQTAFPGCSGLYYKEDDNKNSVQFDGKKFLAPGGSWAQNRFYVTLSQRCHSAQNTGTYSEATKQFEKNVQAVQRLFASAQMKISDPHTRLKRRETPDRPISTSPTHISDPIHERSEQLKSSGKPLTPIEQQFLDLARISTAKDQIIDQHRGDVAKLEEKVKMMEMKLREMEAKLSDTEALSAAQEAELVMLRSLGKEYGTSVEQLNETNKKLAEVTEKLELLSVENKEKEEKIGNIENDKNKLKEDLSKSRSRVDELSQSLQVMSTTKELLSKELDQLRPLSETIGIQEMECIPTYVHMVEETGRLREEATRRTKELDDLQTAFNQLQMVYDPLAGYNRQLSERNEVLEQRVCRIDDDLQKLNEEWAKTLKQRQTDWEQTREDLEAESDSLRNQLNILQKVLDSATREAAEQARRADELRGAKDIPRVAAKLSTSLKF